METGPLTAYSLTPFHPQKLLREIQQMTRPIFFDIAHVTRDGTRDRRLSFVRNQWRVFYLAAVGDPIPRARPEAVVSECFISCVLNDKSSFMLASSAGVGRLWVRAMFYNQYTTEHPNLYICNAGPMTRTQPLRIANFLSQNKRK